MSRLLSHSALVVVVLLCVFSAAFSVAWWWDRQLPDWTTETHVVNQPTAGQTLWIKWMLDRPDQCTGTSIRKLEGEDGMLFLLPGDRLELSPRTPQEPFTFGIPVPAGALPQVYTYRLAVRLDWCRGHWSFGLAPLIWVAPPIRFEVIE